MRGVSTLRAKGTCVRPVALATMNTIERRIMTEKVSTKLPRQLSRDRLKTALSEKVSQFRRDPFQVMEARVPVSCVFRLPRVFLNRRGDVLFR